MAIFLTAAYLLPVEVFGAFHREEQSRAPCFSLGTTGDTWIYSPKRGSKICTLTPTGLQ